MNTNQNCLCLLWKNCFVVRKIYIFLNLFRKHRCQKEKGDHPAYYYCTFQNHASLLVCVCISAYEKSSLHIWQSIINIENYLQFLEKYAPSRLHLFQGRSCIFQHDNAKTHSIRTIWSQDRNVQQLN